uniref:Galactosylceramide sulfotransferase-like n=1 Tax=Saccoglossus kowalevskii TaxID=10224 RepID=A0ABM0M030_SACKO|nr:PREDICTED: galactosylceramide sulfotransferase-like [Saccoglossus kowalevskii]
MYRFGLKHRLIAALPTRSGQINIDQNKNTLDAVTYPCTNSFPGYNYMASHIGHYNYTVLNSFIPNSKFITIMRSPYTQMESAFYYIRADYKHKLENFSNPFAEFLHNYSKIKYRFTMHSITTGKWGQLSMLGYNWAKLKQNHHHIKTKILELDKEMDLVMITEYMDESLVLLKKLMCWTFDDIVYHSCKVRAPGGRVPLSQRTKEVVANWNAGDLLLYDSFNKTFWRKIENYDGNFEEDLRLFRKKQIEITKKCLNSSSEYCRLLSIDADKFAREIVKNRQHDLFCRK